VRFKAFWGCKKPGGSKSRRQFGIDKNDTVNQRFQRHTAR
jgi:hypothetical protein